MMPGFYFDLLLVASLRRVVETVEGRGCFRWMAWLGHDIEFACVSEEMLWGLTLLVPAQSRRPFYHPLSSFLQYAQQIPYLATRNFLLHSTSKLFPDPS